MREIDFTARAAEVGVERGARRVGRFRLVQAAGGFVWTFEDRAEACWYWDAREWRWTGRPQPSATAAEATVGFDPFAP